MIAVSSSIPGEEGRKVIVNPNYIVSIRHNDQLGGSVIEVVTGKVVLCKEDQGQVIDLIWPPSPGIPSCEDRGQ